MVEHKVNIPANQAGSYKIVIGTEILPSLWPRIGADFGRYNKFVVTDENLVRAGHLEKLAGGREAAAFVVSPAGETSKNINTVVSIIATVERDCLGRGIHWLSPWAAGRSAIALRKTDRKDKYA